MSAEQERLPEGTECTFIARSAREEELLPYHVSYRAKLTDGMRLIIYDDYGYSAPDYIGWYFAKDNNNLSHLVHYTELIITPHFDSTLIDWLESLSLVR